MTSYLFTPDPINSFHSIAEKRDMTFLEILIISFNLTTLLVLSKRLRLNMALINIGLIIILFLLDQHRWQMVPSHAFAGLMILLMLLTKKKVRKRSSLIFNRVFLFFIWSVTSIIPYAFPLFDLPAPSGKHQVGTSEWTLTDASRKEIYSSVSDMPRRFNVKVWYPALVKPGSEYNRNTYMPHAKAAARAFGKHSGLPGFLLSHLRLIKTNAFVDAPPVINQSSLPVIIFSHGHAFYASSRQNTSLMEELASHGYFVIALNHTYEAMVTVFGDSNETIPLDTELIREIQKSVVKGTKRDSVIEAIVHARDSLQVKTACGQLRNYNGLFVRSVDIWTDDVAYIINKMLENPPDSRFRGRLDKNRIGIAGMSLGGANAAHSISKIPLIKAGINLDGFLYGDTFSTGISKPFTFMYSDQNNGMNRFMYQRMTGDTYIMHIAGTAHTNFSEFSFFSRIGSSNQIDPYDCHQIISSYCLAFFNKYLLNQHHIDLESIMAAYEDVYLEKLSHKAQ